MGEINIQVRPAEDEDARFVYSTWLRCYRVGSPSNLLIPRKVFYESHHPLLEKLISISNVAVAHPVGEPGVILGYLVFQRRALGDVVHFGFTKSPFREFGVMRTILAAMDVDLHKSCFTFWTRDSMSLIDKFQGFTYNPYLVGGGPSRENT